MVDHKRIDEEDTRQRLLFSAGREFSKVGFAAASVRDICQNAGANKSAIKYYFGSKEGLYLAVWELASSQMRSAEPMPKLTAGDDAEDVLRRFIAWFMRLVIVETQSRQWTGDLLAHETLSPTPGAMETFVRHCCVPVRDELKRLVRAVGGEQLTPRRADDVVYAVIAMCINPRHSESIYNMLGHPVPKSTAAVNRLAGTIADLAIGGLRGFSSGGRD